MRKKVIILILDILSKADLIALIAPGWLRFVFIVIDKIAEYLKEYLQKKWSVEYVREKTRRKKTDVTDKPQ
jgi:hypothetical protein